MEITVGYYILLGKHTMHKTARLNSLEIDEIIEEYLKKEYLIDNEHLISINIEGITDF
jgi:hypothetical protein